MAFWKRFSATRALSGPARPRRRSRGLLYVEMLEVRVLLHAGHDHGDPITQPGFNEPVPGDIVPPWGAEPLHALSSIPALNSLPGAAVSVYLDFDGHYDQVWGTYGSVTTPVYDRNGDPTTFSNSELLAIEQIWAQVAEDFAPFNLNVTTVEPPSFANGVAVRVAIGGNGAWTGGNYGGIAYVNNFTSTIVNTVYVFSDNLSNGNPKRVAEASSHEAGHAFGLRHQSLWNTEGELLAEYFSGPGNGTAPIMGNSYNATRGLWWQGTSGVGPTIIQDDMAMISRPQNGFGYRPDDHGNTAGTATLLSGSGGPVSVSGIITTTSDVDYFAFETAAGEVTLSVTVPTHNNLDARLELRTADGQLIAAAAPSSSFGATIVANLEAGSYRAVVASEGNYGDVGQYTLTAHILGASLEGTVFLDADRDGTFGEGEVGLAGWTLFDDRNQNGVWDATPQFVLPAADTPLAIPSGGPVRSTLETSGLNGTILDVNVRVTLQHPDISRLVLVLTTPWGSISLMSVHPSGGTSMLDTRFDDQAAISISNAAAPYSGTFRPLGSLAGLAGKSPNGTWKLLVSDIVGGEPGVLEDFTLEITTDVAEPTAVTDAQGRYSFGFSTSGGHHIRQFPQPGYVQTSPTGGVHEVLVELGSTYTNLDFGNALPAVVGRALFYNQSSFDGNDPGINAADDLAIAIDKFAYLPGSGLATFASVSSYTRGINGLIVDVAGLTGAITAGDFIFRQGNTNAPELWQPAPAPSDVVVRPGAGIDGADRVEIVWPSGSITNTWLQVIVRGNDVAGGFHSNTGLPASDVFFWGNKIGDSGTSPGVSTFETTTTDALQVFASLGGAKPITDPRDFNRDGQVAATDSLIVFASLGSIIRIDIPQGGAFGPLAVSAGAADEGIADAVASALTVGRRIPTHEPAVRQLVCWGDHQVEQRTTTTIVSLQSIADRTTFHRASDEALATLSVDDELLADLLA